MSYTPHAGWTEEQKQKKKESARRFEKTKKGFLVRLYRNMKSRIEGVQSKKHNLYSGKELLDKQDFYEWALQSDAFHDLFRKYEDSGYERKLAPSVDRINPEIGYTKENMRFVTHSTNSQRTSSNRSVRVNGVLYERYRDAADSIGIPRWNFQHLVEKAVREETFLKYGVWSMVVFDSGGKEIVRVALDHHGRDM